MMTVAPVIDEIFLRASLARALHGKCPTTLLRASIEADLPVRAVWLLFESALQPSDEEGELCSVAATEVIADFESGWILRESA
jgi:hypothetical protein